MDRLDAAGLSWDIYAAGSTDINYEWNICPYFADCLYTSQVNSVKQTTQVVADASAGTLPKRFDTSPGKLVRLAPRHVTTTIR